MTDETDSQIFPTSEGGEGMKLPKPPDDSGASKHVEVEQASGDLSRPTLSDPYLKVMKTAAFLEATDSYILVRIPVEVGHGDVEGHVPSAALQAARKEKVEEVELDGEFVTVTTPKERRSFRRQKGKDLAAWPNTDDILGKLEEQGKFTVAFNPSHLLRLAKALGSERAVTLTFSPTRDKRGRFLELAKLGPIRVEPVRRSGAVGALMPIRLPRAFGGELPAPPPLPKAPTKAKKTPPRKSARVTKPRRRKAA